MKITSDKGVYLSLKECLINPKPINLIVCSNGIFELRFVKGFAALIIKKEGAEAVPKYLNLFKNDIYRELEVGRQGCLVFAKNKIPFSMLQEIISFFKKYADMKIPYEVMAKVYLGSDGSYYVDVPKQDVSRVTINYENIKTADTLVLTIHSHNNMSAVFSSVDDQDEIIPGFYAVVGRCDGYFPEINLRMSCGGKFLYLPLTELFESPYVNYNKAWDSKVVLQEI